MAETNTNTNSYNPIAQTIGVNYPIIQINDTQLASDDIDYCEIEVKDFLPTLILKCTLTDTNLLKMSLPKDGDLVSVFMRPANDYYSYIQCDFVVKQIRTTSYKVKLNPDYKLVIKGELFIPNIHKRGIQRAFGGLKSINILQQIADDFKLGFAITDEKDFTELKDEQVWLQVGESTVDFIKNVTDHAWRDEDAFYDSWIDQYYNLTFSNQNKMLGITKDEDGILDIAKQVSVTSRAVHDKMLEEKNIQSREENLKDTPRIFTNMSAAQYSNNFIEAYSVDSNSQKISEDYGHVIELTYNINNQALYNSGQGTVQQLLIEPSYNKDKLFDHVILRGRARDGYNNEKTLQDFKDNSQETIVNRIWGGHIQTKSDSDPKDTSNGCTGNSFKEYVRAYYHNLINRVELEKIILNLEVRGLNTAVLKGEKIAVLNLEYDQTGLLLNGPVKGIDEDKEIGIIDMFYSGWFIVTGIKFIYDRSINYTGGIMGQNDGLFYKTIISCSRREWVPPESVSPIAFDNEGNLIRKPLGSTKRPIYTPNQNTNMSMDVSKGVQEKRTAPKVQSKAKMGKVNPIQGDIEAAKENKDFRNLTGSFTTGVYSNNPLNIRDTGTPWEGKADPGTFPEAKRKNKFVKFNSIHDGYRAAFKNMKTQYDRGSTTFGQLISVWAPPGENETRSYIEYVCSKIGADKDDAIDFNNKDMMCKMAYAMSQKENTTNVLNTLGVTVEDVAAGYDKAFGPAKSTEA